LPDAIEKTQRVVITLPQRLDGQPLAAIIPGCENALWIKDLMVTQNLWVRIQQGAQQIAARSRNGQNDKSRH
jgi:hypothetical protein